MNYAFTGYDCIYHAIITDSQGKSITIDRTKGSACFSTLFNEFSDFIGNTLVRKANVKLELYCRLEGKPGYDNLLVLDKDEVKWWLNKLQKIVPFNYNRNYTDKYLVLNITTKCSYSELKLLCTLLRIFFEHPYNEIAKDVCLLKRLDCKDINFKTISALNLFIFGSELACAGHGHGFVVSSNYGQLPITINKIKQRIKETYSLNNLLKHHDFKPLRYEKHCTTSDEWRNTFNQRVKKYKEICKREKDLLYRRGKQLRKVDKES